MDTDWFYLQSSYSHRRKYIATKHVTFIAKNALCLHLIIRVESFPNIRQNASIYQNFATSAGTVFLKHRTHCDCCANLSKRCFLFQCGLESSRHRQLECGTIVDMSLLFHLCLSSPPIKPLIIPSIWSPWFGSYLEYSQICTAKNSLDVYPSSCRLLLLFEGWALKRQVGSGVPQGRSRLARMFFRPVDSYSRSSNNKQWLQTLLTRFRDVDMLRDWS